MGLIRVDAEKCVRDGFCVNDCPTAIITMSDDGLPEVAVGKEGSCLECGHCVAVCPYGALNHDRIPLEECPAIQAELVLSEIQAAQFLRSRRSIRRFAKRPVEREKIRKLIETARYAPTGGNSQKVEWVVLDDGRRIREIAALTVEWLREVVRNPQVVAASPYLPLVVAAWDAGQDSVLRGAPVLVTAMAPAEAMNGMVDLTLALSYLDLFAQPLGLGTCWAGLLQGGLLNSAAIREAVGVPETYPHHYPIMVGYPEPAYFRLPERKPPRIHFR